MSSGTRGPSIRSTRPAMPRADRADAPGRAPSAPPLERRRPVACAGLSLLLTLLVLGSCRSLDEGVLDDRLRSATVDAYLDFIEDEFGGMSSSETTLTALREDHRAEAIAASSPEDFYGVLRRMAADLDDPHASLVASERFWSGPLATPERCAVTVADGEVWLALPAESVRTPAGLAEALDGWLDGIGDKVAAGERAASARLLARSATSRAGSGAPMRWMTLDTVEGVSVRSPHGAMLLLDGALGSCVQVSGTLDGEGVTLGLFRNAGRVWEPDKDEYEGPFGPRRLARILDPEVPLPRRAWSVNVEAEAQRLRRRQILRSAAPVGGVEGALAREYGLEAKVLTSPGGRRVGYLRMGDFERTDWPGGAVPAERDEQLLERLRAVMEELGPYEDWVVDLTQNHGGRWLDLGTMLSFFLPEEFPLIPHEVRAVREGTRWGFIPILERWSAQQVRVEVPCVLPRNLLVLVDQGTASSGEILACSMRAIGGARLVGERTVGAELAVTALRGPDGSLFKVGGAGGMLEPCEHFQARGLEPDHLIQLAPPDQAGLGPSARREALQLEALVTALELIDGAQL